MGIHCKGTDAREMAMLTIATTNDKRLAGEALLGLAREKTSGFGQLAVLVPSYDEKLLVQKAFADAGLGMRITVDMAAAWLESQWELAGDGRSPIAGDVRRLVIARALGETESSLPASTGNIAFIAGLAAKGVRSVAKGDGISENEAAVGKVLARYRRMLDERGLIETIDIAAGAAGFFPDPRRAPAVIFAGYDKFGALERRAIAALSAQLDVTLLLRADCAPARTAAARLAAELEQELPGAKSIELAAEGGSASGELAALSEALFNQERAAAVEPEGAVRLLYPSGPKAEAELVFEELAELLDAGFGPVAVVHPEAERLWKMLAPKLDAHGITGACRYRTRLADQPAYRSVMSWLRFVAELPPASDMSWWPPLDITDFLLSELSGVSHVRAYELDAAWRSNRSLLAREVLATLCDSERTSEACAQATELLMQGQLEAALLCLAAQTPLGASAAATLRTMAKAAAAAGALKPLSEAVDALALMVDGAGIPHLASVGAGTIDDASVIVAEPRMLGAYDAGAFGSLIYLGLDSVASPVPSTTLADTLLADLGIEPERDTLAETQLAFARAVARAGKRLRLGRALFDANTRETYPAMVLTEAIECYERADGSNPLSAGARSLPEDRISKNLLAGSKPLVPLGEESRSYELGSAANVLLESSIAKQGEEPYLSATQIESYLTCPHLWLLDKKLNATYIDRTLGPQELGSFAHRVLEELYNRLVARGERVEEDNIDAVRAMLDEVFDKQLKAQASLTEGNPLIAHDYREERAICDLKEDLAGFLEADSVRFDGFVPLACELSFGEPGTSLEEFSFAGARFHGTIDRIDVNHSTRQIIVLDYKRGKDNFNKNYGLREAAWTSKNDDRDAYGYHLPRHVQALIYAVAVQRMADLGKKPFEEMSGYAVVASLYARTSPVSGSYPMLGAVDDAAFENIKKQVWGNSRLSWQIEHKVRPSDVGLESYEELLALSEKNLAQAIRSLDALEVAPDPREDMDGSCNWCPINASCERSLV